MTLLSVLGFKPDKYSSSEEYDNDKDESSESSGDLFGDSSDDETIRENKKKKETTDEKDSKENIDKQFGLITFRNLMTIKEAFGAFIEEEEEEEDIMTYFTTMNSRLRDMQSSNANTPEKEEEEENEKITENKEVPAQNNDIFNAPNVVENNQPANNVAFPREVQNSNNNSVSSFDPDSIVTNNAEEEDNGEDIFKGKEFKKAEIIEETDSTIGSTTGYEIDEEIVKDLFETDETEGDAFESDNSTVPAFEPEPKYAPFAQFVQTPQQNVFGQQQRVQGWIAFHLPEIPDVDSYPYDLQLQNEYTNEKLLAYAKQ